MGIGPNAHAPEHPPKVLHRIRTVPWGQYFRLLLLTKKNCKLGLGHKMYCLYCKKRLWTLFSKERLFCSKLHEAAYQDGLSAMNRLMEFTVPAEPPNGPATGDQKRSQRERESRMPMLWTVAVPPLCNLVLTWGRPKPVATPLAASVVLPEAEAFTGPVEFPSSSRSLIACALDVAIEPAQELAVPNERTAVCRVQSKRGRRIPSQSPTAFSSRTHRRRLR